MMLAALRQLADRLETEGILLPPNYKLRQPVWHFNFTEGDISFLDRSGPYKKGDYSAGIKEICAPDCQRSGKDPQPFLLVDQARYVFGIADRGKEEDSKRRHQDYLDLLKRAVEKTGDPSFEAIYHFLTSLVSNIPGILEKIKPEEIVAFKIGENNPCLNPAIIEFWNSHLEEDASARTAVCLVCGNEQPILRKLPREIVVLGQKCVISSFNDSAYLSYGKQQTENAPMCFTCANKIISSLDYLTKSPKAEIHRRIIMNNPKRPIHNQLAVFWLKERQEINSINSSGRNISIEELLGVALTSEPTSEPPASLSQLESLLEIPWTGSTTPLGLPENRFYLALLSANKARLVLRTWIDASLGEIKENLGRYIKSLKIVDPYGGRVKAFSIPELIEALDVEDPSIVGKLIRTAFMGLPPPFSLLSEALRSIHNPSVFNSIKQKDIFRLHAVMASLKHSLLYRKGEEEMKLMETLDPERNRIAYLCGRLLAILEEAQRRASGTKLNRTLVDSFYASASSSPSSYLGLLLNRSHTSHLSKIRKDGKDYTGLTKLLEDVLSRIDNEGGFPARLDPREQAEFALGFYHQRADFRAKRSTIGDVESNSKEIA
ncbi:MAG: type I-C CRISPR-associated protein Cas8c/Csd1 [Actinobacteria bacterium]|nr:type I-C CRISPR-associated protein Cas8c/Csd1 [Actinomycetota bacterium]